VDWVRAGLRVTVEGESDLFTVLRVDRTRYLADLLRDGAVRKVQSNIPLTLLRPAAQPDTPVNVKLSA
jgi:hypothetical protein